MIKRFLIALLFCISSVFAATPLTLVTTTGPGSLADSMIRKVQPELEKELNRPILILNIPGALGQVGLEQYQRMPHDGNSVLMVGSQLTFFAVNPPVNSDIDFMNDFEPLYGLAKSDAVVLVPSSSPVTNMKEFVSYAKKKGSLLGGNAHPATQMSMALLDKALHIKTIPVNYSKTSQMTLDVAAGTTDYTISGRGNSNNDGLVKAGKMRIVGEIKNYGVEEFMWTAFFIHKDAPTLEKAKLIAALSKFMNSPEVRNIDYPQAYLQDANGIKKQMNSELKAIKSIH